MPKRNFLWQIRRHYQKKLKFAATKRTSTPGSKQKLAALADCQWYKDGPSARVGTEKWREVPTRIGFLPSRRIRHGAALMAGVSLNEIPGAKHI